MLTEAIELHQRLRFDPAEPEPAVVQRLKCLAEELEASLKRRRVIKGGGRPRPPQGPRASRPPHPTRDDSDILRGEENR